MDCTMENPEDSSLYSISKSPKTTYLLLIFLSLFSGRCFADLSVTASGAEVLVEWSRSLSGPISTGSYTASVSGPGLSSSAEVGSETMTVGSGEHIYSFEQCASYFEGSPQCETATASVTITGVGVSPDAVDISPSAASCDTNQLELTWSEVASMRYAVEARGRATGGAWGDWSRIIEDQLANNTKISPLSAGRDYQFRVSARVSYSSGSEYLEWRNSSVVSVPDCSLTITETPFEAEASMVSEDEIAATDEITTIRGDFRVNEAGAATYSIPIVVAPGSAGVAPEIALSYSSQSLNGLLGRGWNLTGLRGISRCRQTLMQDKIALPITWGSDDRFCLDGSRLLLVGDGEYGEPGSQYKTEVDTFVTITAIGGTTGRPDYFEMRAKDGSSTRFGAQGNHPSERVAYEGNEPDYEKVLTWNISLFEDSVGNPITYAYSRLSSYHRLSEVSFAYGGTDSPAASISFEYESRDDPTIGFLAGYSFNNNGRLAEIISRNGDDEVRRYKLNYYPSSQNEFSSKVSHITSIDECVGSDCYSKTSFGWGGYGAANTRTKKDEDYEIDLGSNTNIENYNFADIDGNGILDPIWVANFRLYYELNGVRFSSGGAPDGGELRVLDYNLDGRDDILLFAPGATVENRWRLFLSSPLPDTSTEGEVQWRLQRLSDVSMPFSEKQVQFIDYDSDGITDAYYLNKEERVLSVYRGMRSGEAVTSNLYYTFSSNPASVLIPGTGLLDYDDFAWGDFNADGLIDVVLGNRTGTATGRYSASSYGIELFQSNADGSLEDVATLSTSKKSIQSLRVADINGDGLSDVLWLYTDGNWRYRLNNGISFEEEKAVAFSGENVSHPGMQIVDINHDGYQDVYWQSGSEVMFKTWQPGLNRFSKESRYSYVGWGSSGIAYSLRDVDNNGQVDLIGIAAKANFSDGGRGIRVEHSDRADRRFIKTFRNSLGASTQIEYSPLNGLVKENLYTTYEGVAVSSDEVEVCEGGYSITTSDGGYVPRTCSLETQYTVDASQFYREVNDPYSHLPEQMQVLNAENIAPAMELKGGLPVVSKVFSSAPTANDPDFKAGVDYRYKLNLVQAAGRGMLGFRELITTDLQTGIVTRSHYRQDWPFVGQPLSTMTLSPDSNKLSEALNSSKILGWSASMEEDLLNDGSAALGPLQVYVDKVTEVEYSLQANGASQGSETTKTITTIEPDEYGNALSTEVHTSDYREGEYTQTTVNTYGEDEWHQRFGRLTQSVVSHERSDPDQGTVNSSNVAQFSYFDEDSGALAGLLRVEVANVGDDELELRTEHHYDEFGNSIFQTFQGKDGVKRLTTASTFDERGRYEEKSFGLFNREVSSTDDSDSDSSYRSERTRLLGSSGAAIQKMSEVTGRNSMGLPTESLAYNGPSSSISQQVAYTHLGTQYFASDSSGSYTLSTGAKGAGYHCGVDTVFYAREQVAGGAESVTCHDLIGREIRTGEVGFDGNWSYVDTEYDEAGRVARISDPHESTPSGWTSFEYDLLGRQIKTIKSDGSETSISFTGLTQTTNNDLGQFEIKIYSGTGELRTSGNNEASEVISYFYTADGKLSYTTAANGSVVNAKIEYDAAGNKVSMDDPDKGLWRYRYNSLGELVCQQDAEGQTVVNNYDFAGRMVRRTSRLSGGSCDNPSGTVQSTSAWQYDTNDYGMGKLALEWSGLSGRTQSSPDYKRIPNYDSLGRVSSTVTTLRGHDNKLQDHWQKISYDQFNRPWKVWDSARSTESFTSNGIENIYDSSGFLYKVKDAHSATVYYEVLAVDARGNVIADQLGGGAIRRSSDFNESTGRLEYIGSRDSMGRYLQDLTLDWDTVGNLNYRHERGVGIDYESRDLFEDFTYDDFNQLTDYSVIGGSTDFSKSVKYDRLGNITNKSDVGAYTYESEERNANAAKAAGGVTYNYNKNGSMISDSRGREFTYNVSDQVTLISKSSRTSEFFYDANKKRFKRVDSSSAGTTTTLYLGNVEKIHHDDDSREWRRYIGNSILITQKFDDDNEQTAKDTQYMLSDHLGSVNVITDGSGVIQTVMSFDPWGKRRAEQSWESLSSTATASSWFVTTKPTTSRGFTSHQMVDEMEIVHMNGRIYDPLLGRFLQADPHIQAPEAVISFNRYAYVWNNPLNATDPSGFFLDKLWNDVVRPLAGVIVAVVLTAYAPSGAGFWWATFVGAASGAVSAAVNGGDILRGAAFGALSAAAFYGVGEAFEFNSGDFFGSDYSASDFASKVMAHGMVGGVMSVLQGGKFGHGFASAGVSQAFAGKINGMGVKGARIASSAIVGGTVSHLTGGKFGNGALTAAFGRMFNEEMHELARKWKGGQGQMGRSSSALGKDASNPLSANSTSEFKQCVNTCIQNRYGSLYEAADALNPLSVSGLVGNEVAEVLDTELQKQGTRNSYGNAKEFRTGRRQLKTLSQFRKFNAVSLVVGAGAIGFQLGAQGYCRIECTSFGD